MKERRFAAITSIMFMFGHLGLLPYIVFFPSRLSEDQKLDLVLIIAPMTAAYMVTVTQYVIYWRHQAVSIGRNVNFTFVLFSATFVLAFFLCAYGIIYLAENRSANFEPESIKKWIGGVEVFVGASLALLMKSLFETGKS
jgi:tellurite resistance protein TehA-like permease